MSRRELEREKERGRAAGQEGRQEERRREDTMMADPPGGAGFDDRMGDALTVSSVLKEFQGLKDKFKNEDEDDCEFSSNLLLIALERHY